MPKFRTYQDMLGKSGNTIGQVLFNQSNNVLESSWWEDTQAKLAYVYDYYNDDDRERNYWKYNEYHTETKIAVPIKHLLDAYESMEKDSVSVQVQFLPSQKMCDFDQTDSLYFYQNNFIEKYQAHFPIGLYIDIPNKDKTEYRKYIICKSDVSDTFQKHFILECDYLFQWIAEIDGKRVKQQMWCATRNQSS